jgi:DNA-binding beta-propeller fold protein YncE
MSRRITITGSLAAATLVLVAVASISHPADPRATALERALAATSSAPPGTAAGSPATPALTAPSGALAGPSADPPQSGASASLTPSGPMPGELLIADRGNDRLLIVTPDRRVIWSMTIDPGGPRGSQSWGPDDAFFTPDGRHIIVNDENAHTISIVDIATRQVVWRYGHSGVAGRAAGYLNGPDDAYQLPDGTVTVADIKNDRVLFISPRGVVVRRYGTTGISGHTTLDTLASPNGDVPLPDGGMLITEIGGQWVDRLDSHGRVVWRIHLRDIAYPSDAQLLPNGNVLVVDYSNPGRVEEIAPTGRIVWRYLVRSGPGLLAHPSLAVRLSNGDVAVTNDHAQTVVVIDPRTNRIVWTYGHVGRAGTAAGYLDNPDGLDPVPAATAAWLDGLLASASVMVAP